MIYMIKKKRNTYYLSIKIQDAMRKVSEVERIAPSNQIELAVTEYLKKKYKSTLKKHKIVL